MSGRRRCRRRSPASAMKKLALLLTPWLLLASTTTVFRRLAARLGPKGGYFGGFLFYWIFWCLLLPLWVLGPLRLSALLAWTCCCLPYLLSWATRWRSRVRSPKPTRRSCSPPLSRLWSTR